MKQFFQTNDFTSLDGVMKFTMAAWWPIATIIATIFICSQIFWYVQ